MMMTVSFSSAWLTFGRYCLLPWSTLAQMPRRSLAARDARGALGSGPRSTGLVVSRAASALLAYMGTFGSGYCPAAAPAPREPLCWSAGPFREVSPPGYACLSLRLSALELEDHPGGAELLPPLESLLTNLLIHELCWRTAGASSWPLSTGPCQKYIMDEATLLGLCRSSLYCEARCFSLRTVLSLRLSPTVGKRSTSAGMRPLGPRPLSAWSSSKRPVTMCDESMRNSLVRLLPYLVMVTM
mmetsp:Transcript_3056/g.8905  ORF Transcript_3056/g.8905 Transcript_3056/m.8905 type:complete len:242 (-) Transcript_3056:247-972(-)